MGRETETWFTVQGRGPFGNNGVVRGPEEFKVRRSPGGGEVLERNEDTFRDTDVDDTQATPETIHTVDEVTKR